MGGSLSCNTSSLPEDLLIEILLYLPIKTLLRFKSVCKPWLSLIESSEFIHRHTNTITLSPDNNNNLLGTFIFPSYNEILHENHRPYKVEVLWNMFCVTNDHKSYKVFEEELPMQQRAAHIVGSCNGLICLQDDKVRDVSLWNPAINQFRILPKPLTFAEINNGKVYNDFVAIGFDVETKDYKVVLVTYFSEDDFPTHFISKYHCPYRVQVYSLSTDSWRALEDLVIPTYPQRWWEDGYGGYLNGCYYGLGEEWISGSPSYSRRIPSDLKTVWSVLSFDFTKEIFRTMELPDEITRARCITFLDEKIAIIDKILNNYYHTYHIWVLNELGVKESWTKLYTIGSCGELNQIPNGISNHGELIFLNSLSNDRNLHLLNPYTQESYVVKGLQILQYVRNDDHLKAIVYKRSLVPVGGTRNPK